MASYKDFIEAIKRHTKEGVRAAGRADGKYNDFMAAAGKYLVDTGTNTVKGAVVDPARQISAQLTGNRTALRNAQEDSATDNQAGLGGQVLRNFVARPAEEIAATVTNRSIKNTTPFMQAIAGNEDADSIQKKTADTYTSFKKKGGAMGALAIPAAIGEAGLSVANDIPVLGGGLKAGEKIIQGGFKAAKIAKDASPAMKAAEAATGLNRAHVVNDDEAYALKGFGVDPDAKPTPAVRQLLDRAGIDHSDESSLKERVNQYLDKRDNFIDTHEGVAQGGYIGGRPEKPTADVPESAATDTQAPPVNQPSTSTLPETPQADNLAPPELPTSKPSDLPSGKPLPKESYGEATDELLGRTKFGQEAKDAATKEKGAGVREQLKEQFYDRFSPVNSLVRHIEDTTGAKYRAEDDPYALMRLSQGLPDAVNQKVQGIADVLKQAPDIQSVKAVGMARQILSRSERGITSTISPERARQVIEEQRARLGDEGFQRTADIVDAVGDYNKDMLNELHSNGVISDAALEAINETGGDYFSKMNVLSKSLEKDQNRGLFSRSGSFNATKQSVKKVLAEASGHQEGEELLDPIESLVLGTNNAMRLISKNNVFHAFQGLAKDAPDLVVPIREADKVEEKISLASDNAALRPIRNKLVRVIKANKNGIRRLATEVNRLEKQGLNLSLRKGGERMAQTATDASGNSRALEFDVGGLGGKVATGKTGKLVSEITDDRTDLVKQLEDSNRRSPNSAKTRGLRQDVIAEQAGVNAQTVESKLGPKDTVDFIRSLIEKGSQKDINRIKKKVGTRDAKMSALLDKLTDIKSQYDDVATQVRANSDRTKELADADVPDGYSVITGYDKGIESKLAVPKDVADVYTGKTPSQQDYLTSIVNKVNGFVKQNFTSNNPAFALLTNPIRDAKSFAYNAKNVKGNPIDIGAALAKGFMARVLPDKINPYNDIVDRWVAAGGKSGFYSDERSGEKIAKDISLEVNGKRSAKSLGVKVNEVHNAKEFAREAGRVISAPLRTARDKLHGAASVLEDAPRVAQFMATVKAGKTDAEAALDARNVTVDFSQAGRIGQTVNAWVPFLNARGQGTIKSIQAIKNNPARAAAVYAALTATPIALAALNNNRYKDVLKMIPDQDRDNNFVIVLNDHQDADGNYTGVLKIPKSDVDKTLGNPLEMVFRKMSHDNPDNLQAVITNLVGSLSPVDFVKDDKLNSSRAVGGILPAFVKAPIENSTNHNLYYDSDLVPEGKQDLPDRDQVNDNTSHVAQLVGNLTGASPIKVDNTLRNFTGSLLTESPQDQLGGKLVGANATRMNTEFYKILQNTSREKAEVSQQINQAIEEGDVDTAQRLATSYNTYLAKQFTPFAKTYRAQLTPDLTQLYDKQPLVLTRRSISQRQRNILERQAAQ